MILHAWRFRATIAAAAALATVALAGCASSSSGPAHPATGPARSTGTSRTAEPGPAGSVTPAATVRTPTTATHVFAAFDSSGAPVAGVTARRSGKCWTSSITVSARAAYRCFAGNQILDPCFAAAATTGVVDCYASPWSTVVQLTLTAKLPAPGAPLKISQPWALELGAGNRCVVTTGTAPIVDGATMRYRCDRGTAGLLGSGNASPGRAAPAGAAGRALQAQLRTLSGAIQRAAVLAEWTA